MFLRYGWGAFLNIQRALQITDHRLILQSSCFVFVVIKYVMERILVLCTATVYLETYCPKYSNASFSARSLAYKVGMGSTHLLLNFTLYVNLSGLRSNNKKSVYFYCSLFIDFVIYNKNPWLHKYTE